MIDWAGRLRDRWQRVTDVLRAPRVPHRGSREATPRARSIARFTARHPRLRIHHRAKPAGAWPWPACRDVVRGLPSRTHEEGPSAEAEARGRRRDSAMRLGRPQERLDEIMADQPLDPKPAGPADGRGYLDREAVSRSFDGRGAIHGILDRDGRLARVRARASTSATRSCSRRYSGTADDLERGAMYLLISESIRASIEARRPDGTPQLGDVRHVLGARGAAYFKERVGFRQHRSTGSGGRARPSGPRSRRRSPAVERLGTPPSAVPNRRAEANEPRSRRQYGHLPVR